MTELSTDTIQQLRTVIREEVTFAVREEVTLAIRQEVTPMVHREITAALMPLQADIASLASDMDTVKYTLGSHGLMLGGLRSDVHSLKQSARAQSKDIYQLAVLFEDLDDRFEAIMEAR